MDWIANMPGPQFLGFYAAVIVSTLVAAYILIRSSGNDSGVDPLVSTSPDPYLMAYMRGDDVEVAKLALIELARRGFIQERTGASLTGGKVYLRQSDGHPHPALLPAPLRQVFELVGKEEKPLARLMKASAFRQAMEDLTKSAKEKMSREGLLVDDAARLKTLLFGTVVILGLGGFKLAAALSAGRFNVGFLILLLVAGMFGLMIIAGLRLTARGRKHFLRTQDAYRPDTSGVVLDASAAQNSALLLHLGLFGAPILFGTSASAYATMLGLDPKQRYGASGCGAGCGSSSSSSGGGEGGGGGCGGGCGGCGGG